ncbi:MAG: GntR family transcriptional regulator, partial [Desulfobacterales bacterium]|nr:GntR family transcriptional regulator [Desulfobacterales bacterium]
MNDKLTLSLINKNSAQPLYQQIKDVVYTSIKQGKWQTGQKIPSENELVEMFSVSRMTVHRALRELTSEGILNR